ncbi:helix-turn-helix domain-containing protein [Bradyrhizobium yuanmingense]|uniref:helix-turn-helix domain-containing protein n=1 Tax=Bradyrhizobium yuanmingense TaxID=108015 RepID=UPI00351725A7
MEFFGTTIRSQYWESRYRRVSPRALAVRPVHQARWEIRAFGFDPENNEPLLETCPVCGRRFGWVFMRGPTTCDHCTDRDGYPSTDLRDHPQPLLQIADPEAVLFVANLVHPEPDRRRAAMGLVPDGLAGATNGELFEAAMCMASALRPGAATKMTDAGRPLRAPDFAAIDPDMLGMAGRALIGGEEGFAALTARMRLSADERTASHGLYKELGPLAAMPLDRHLSPVVRSFANDAIARDLARTRDDGFVRRSVPRLADVPAGAWLTMDALSSELGLSKHALGRLSESGAVEVRRAGGELSPVLMKIAEVAPLAAAYKDCVLVRRVRAFLRIPDVAIEELARRALIQRAEGGVAAMLRGRRYYRETSAKALLIAIRERAQPDGEGGRRVKLIVAVRRSGRAAPWADIVEGITTGALRIYSKKPFGRDWRYAVTVDKAELGLFLERVGGPADPGGKEPWLTRDQAAQLLGVDETIVWLLGKQGFLTKREGHFAMFSRAEVKQVASRYVFGPEMIRRSVFGQGAQLNRWLNSVGVQPVATLRGKSAKVYDRLQFESVLHLQPKPLDEVVMQPRQKHRISTLDKEQAIAAVRSGLTPHHVGQRMGLYHSTVARWVKEFDETGRLRPAGKFEPYVDAIIAMIEADPAHSTHALWKKFNKTNGLAVAYTSFSAFIAEIGFSRDPATKRLLRRA